MKKLENKVVFITGGNSGIGKACAIEAAREGARVVVTDLPAANPDETLREIEAQGVEALFLPVDVGDVGSVKKGIRDAVERFGRIDVALNNAGIGGPYSGIHDMDEKVWEKIININLNGQFYCIKYELQQFLKQGGGVIVNMSSLAGLVAEKGLAPYTAAKHGLIGLTKNIAVQYGDQNIRANAICPYYIDTPLLSTIPGDIRKLWEEATPAKRLGKAEEVARAFVFFASDDSTYCNGTHLAIDGGVLA
ncbi:MAG: SDR family oxidoreductase [Hymenobacteraceae bacterium]|nr:SDR family oxidoreductase [Hymenobacteraceae bacterium]MDX5482693.1 SDR family oxidoreductase [Hymenobacteraceae bacterium]